MKQCSNFEICVTFKQFWSIGKGKLIMWVGGHLDHHTFPMELEKALAKCCKFWRTK